MNTSMKTALGLLLLTAGATQSAHAQGLYIFAPETPYTKAIKKYEYYFFSSKVDRINDSRAEIAEAIKQKLGTADRFGKGITLYNMKINLGEAKFRFIGNDQFEITMPGNHFYARATQPAVGEWGNFAAEVNFDLRVYARLKLPTIDNPKLEMASAVVSVPRIEAKSRNVVTGVAGSAALLINQFNQQATGRDLIAEATGKYLRIDLTNRINSGLAPINASLGKLASYKMAPTISIANQILKIEFSAPQITAGQENWWQRRTKMQKRWQQRRPKHNPANDGPIVK